MIAIAASMQYPESESRAAVWTGRGLSALGAVFLAFDASVKVLALPIAADATAKLGWPVDVMLMIGAIEIVCLVAYLIPRTAPLGAILWTGYLGGAVATHVRVGNPPFETIFPIIVAAILWTGLWLRDHRVRALTA
jgi:hypothetical protein